ncbi:MAG: RidA family protein [Devosiaceae bacterium]|nr:RidA family protein [Devosiaceae bacterium MH13]
MDIRMLEPEGIYPPTPDYRHGVELSSPSRVVYTAGTMGLELDGTVPADIDRQLELIWDNLRAILANADMTVDNIVRLTSYLADRKYAEKNGNARVEALGGRAVPTTAIVCDLLDPAWLIEIEIIAAA